MREVNQRAQDNFVVRRLSLYMEWGRDLFWDKKLEEDVARLTAADVNKAMKKYLDPDQIHMAKAGDFAKNEQ